MSTNFLVALGFGAFVGLSIYFSFDFLYSKITSYFSRILAETEKAYRELFIIKTRAQIKRELILLCTTVSLILVFLLWPSAWVLPLVLLAIPYLWQLPLKILNGPTRQRRVAQFSAQFVDGLTLMSNSLRSGLNMAQALQNVVDEMNGPIKEEFGLVLSENKLGLTLEQALENFSKRLPSEDVEMFVTSVNILRETGGNIAETFDTITNTIRERIKLKNKIDAMTAQGKMSSMVVGSLPWLIAGVLYSLDAKTMTPLFVTPMGWAILAGVLILEGIGFLVIRKIVQIKV